MVTVSHLQTPHTLTNTTHTHTQTRGASSGAGNAACRGSYADAESSACRFRSEASECGRAIWECLYERVDEIKKRRKEEERQAAWHHFP